MSGEAPARQRGRDEPERIDVGLRRLLVRRQSLRLVSVDVPTTRHAHHGRRDAIDDGEVRAIPKSVMYAAPLPARNAGPGTMESSHRVNGPRSIAFGRRVADERRIAWCFCRRSRRPRR
jgi:hypothetical protein